MYISLSKSQIEFIKNINNRIYCYIFYLVFNSMLYNKGSNVICYFPAMFKITSINFINEDVKQINPDNQKILVKILQKFVYLPLYKW